MSRKDDLPPLQRAMFTNRNSPRKVMIDGQLSLTPVKAKPGQRRMSVVLHTLSPLLAGRVTLLLHLCWRMIASDLVLPMNLQSDF